MYDRALHSFKDTDVIRISKRFTDDNLGWIDAVLNVMVQISYYMLQQILALVGADALTGTILNWLIQMGNMILEYMGFKLTEAERNNAAYQVANMAIMYMSPEQAYAFGKSLTAQYAWTKNSTV